MHRDLKPANVKITPEGVVKVLDFGLPKAAEEASTPSGDPSMSPTLTIGATRAGVILGTAAYMAPEQAHGRPADRRADIWSFGVVLYEMLTGKQMFTGESISEVLASVLKTDPDWEALPATTTPPIRKLLQRLLTKDRKQRLQAIGEARIAIEQYLAAPEPATAAASQSPKWRSWIWATAGVAIGLALASAGWWAATRPAPRPLMRLHVELGPDIELSRSVGGDVLALSPDGTRFAMTVRGSGGRASLAARLLDQTQVTLLSGTDNAGSPFFSPDSQWIAFFADRKLKKVSVLGGAPVTLCESGAVARGGSWGDDGNIIASLSTTGGLSRIPDGGGVPAPATELKKDERTHRWPQVLPGSQAVLFTAHSGSSNYDDANIEVHSFKTGERKTLHRGGYHARYLPSGRLVFLHKRTLFAAPFDPGKLALTGAPAPVIEDAGGLSSGAADFDSSRTGHFAYLSGRMTQTGLTISWLDGTGKTQPLHPTPGLYASPKFSPDGKRLAFSMDSGQGADIWVRDIERDTPSRLSFLPGRNGYPVWTPDGKHLVFRSSGHATPGIYWIRSDGSGEPRKLTELAAWPHSFSPDGKRLAITGQDSGLDILTAPLEGDPASPRLGKPEPFVKTPFNDGYPEFSPDGRWIAYDSNESGASEVYVRPFPGPGGKWQISTGGGAQPIWSRNGRELFFRSGDMRLMVADYTAKGDSFARGKPRVWSERRLLDMGPYPLFDLTPDGKRFAAMLAQPETGEQKPVTHLMFLVNFFDELRRRVPAGR